MSSVGLREVTLKKKPSWRWVLGENLVNYQRELTLRVGKLEGRMGHLGIDQVETVRSARGMNQGKSSGKV